MAIRYFMPVLEGDLAAWLGLGWRAAARDRRPSLTEAIVLLEWGGRGAPPVPHEVRA
jgi:hypothetical protein